MAQKMSKCNIDRRDANFFSYVLTLKAPVTTAADNIHEYIFIVFQIFFEG